LVKEQKKKTSLRGTYSKVMIHELLEEQNAAFATQLVALQMIQRCVSVKNDYAAEHESMECNLVKKMNGSDHFPGVQSYPKKRITEVRRNTE